MKARKIIGIIEEDNEENSENELLSNEDETMEQKDLENN